MDFLQQFSFLYDRIAAFFTGDGWKNLVMLIIGGVLIYLALVKDFEPALLMPMGFGAILVNLPFSGAVHQMNDALGDEVKGIIDWLFDVGIEASEAMPLLLFIGIGAMIDFGPLLSNPKMLLFGAGAQFGIFLTVLVASFFFPSRRRRPSASLARRTAPPPCWCPRYSSRIIWGPLRWRRILTWRWCPSSSKRPSAWSPPRRNAAFVCRIIPGTFPRKTRILFPIIVTIIAGLVASTSVSLVGMLMFGNLLRECLKLDSLSQTAQTTLANLITILLGLTISASMKAEAFVRVDTLVIMGLGLLAFIFDTIGGVMLAKLMNLFLPKDKKINPMVGGAGISAFPMSARVIQKMALKEDNQNHLLMRGGRQRGRSDRLRGGRRHHFDRGSPIDQVKERCADEYSVLWHGAAGFGLVADADGHGRHFRGHGRDPAHGIPAQ